MRLTESELIVLIKSRVAPSPLSLEISDDTIRSSLKYAQLWFVSNAGIRAITRISLVRNIVEYQMDDAVHDVIDVHFPSRQLPAVEWEWEFLGLSGIPANYRFLWPGTMDYSALYQMMQRMEEGKRIISADPDWRYRMEDRVLEIYPASHGTGTAIVEYISSDLDYSKINNDDLWLFIRWAVADVKEILGRLRTKHSAIPGPGGEQTLDGDRLLEEAKAEKEKLQEDVRNRNMPAGFIIG